jgi:hypothetical protein
MILARIDVPDSAWKGREDVWSLARGGETTEPRGEAWDHPLLTEVLSGEGPEELSELRSKDAERKRWKNMDPGLKKSFSGV